MDDDLKIYPIILILFHKREIWSSLFSFIFPFPWWEKMRMRVKAWIRYAMASRYIKWRTGI